MLVEMKQLLRGRDICVSATVAGSKPHCSLMACATTVFFRTPRTKCFA